MVADHLTGLREVPYAGRGGEGAAMTTETNGLLSLKILRKPASWLVAVCERSENRGCGGEWLTKCCQISLSGWEKGG